MRRRGVSGVTVVAGLIVGLIVGLGAMYVLAPSIITSGSTNSNVSTTTVISTTILTSTVGGSGATTITETSTLTSPITTLPPTTKTETTTVVSTVNGGQGFSGSVVYVSIPSGTGSNQNQNFAPVTTTVLIGVNNTIVWTNNDVVQHTVTADTISLFNTVLNPGQSFGYTFTQPGTFGYSCQLHGWMIARVIVKS